MYSYVPAASDATSKAVGVLADLQGPKIRLGNFTKPARQGDVALFAALGAPDPPDRPLGAAVDLGDRGAQTSSARAPLPAIKRSRATSRSGQNIRCRSVGSSRAAVIIASTSRASTARGGRWVRRDTRSSSLSPTSRARTPWRVSQRVNPRRVESIRATVASLQRRLAVITASTRRLVLRSDRDRGANADATSSRASFSVVSAFEAVVAEDVLDAARAGRALGSVAAQASGLAVMVVDARLL